MKNLLNEIKAMNNIAGTELTKEQEIAIIRERLEQLNEAENKTDRLVRFFSIKGIDTKYDAAVVKEWGKDTVDMAIKSAPKILALKKKIDSIGKDIASSDEGKLLIKIMKQSAGFVYDYRTGTEVGALFDRYYKGK